MPFVKPLAAWTSGLSALPPAAGNLYVFALAKSVTKKWLPSLRRPTGPMVKNRGRLVTKSVPR
jgi:hypothetical protein